MQEFRLFDHWTFESFAPGSIPRAKYNAFRNIHRESAACFSLLARFEDLAAGRNLADWCRVSGLTSELVQSIRRLVDLLQVMNPVEFMDAHDWFAKLSFYARLSTEHAAVSVSPPYLLPVDALPADFSWVRTWLPATGGRGLVLTAALYQYFVEANDLRDAMDVLLRNMEFADEVSAATASEQLRAMILGARLPERLREELEIAGMELATGQRMLELRAVAGNGDDAVLIGEKRGVRAADFFAAWLDIVACKFSRSSLALRLKLGLADEEHPLSVMVFPSDEAAGDQICRLWNGESDPGAFVRRLESILPRVSRLNVFREHGGALRPEQCRSLHDLVCLCLERGLAQIFAFAGEPARGLAGIKQMRLEIPVVINTFNLGGGLFPTAAERAVISMEDVRSAPAWSFLMGLANPVSVWPAPEHDETAPTPHYSSYAVLAQCFMHCTLRLEQSLYAVECDCHDGAPKYVHFRFMAQGADAAAHVARVALVRHILEGEGFDVWSCGNCLDAVRSGGEDVYLQRSLVTLGLLVAWLQTDGQGLGAVGGEEGAARFRTLLKEVRSNPL